MKTLRFPYALAAFFTAAALCRGMTLTVASSADDGSAGTLRAIIGSAAAGDTVTFDPSIAGQTISLAYSGKRPDAAIVISNSLRIVGPSGGITIDGGCAASNFDAGTRIFASPFAGSSLSLEGLTLANANGRDWSSPASTNIGGAVYGAGPLAVTNVVFRHNTAVGASIAAGTPRGGGAILAGGPLSVHGCSFYTNRLNSSGFFGGAIYAGKQGTHEL